MVGSHLQHDEIVYLSFSVSGGHIVSVLKLWVKYLPQFPPTPESIAIISRKPIILRIAAQRILRAKKTRCALLAWAAANGILACIAIKRVEVIAALCFCG